MNKSQLAFGEAQVVKMLRDRPAMVKYTKKDDPVWEWTVRQFAGEWVKGGIEWDASDPIPLWDAMYYGAEGDKKARIQITERSAVKNFHFGEPKSGIELWFEAVFEFCNLRSLQVNKEIHKMALKGQMDEEEYAFRECYLEAVNTRQNVHDFFEGLWVPNCKKLDLPAWDEFMVSTNNRDVPVYEPGQFIDMYFGVDYDHPRKDRLADEDLAFHRGFFLKQYKDYFLPDLKAKEVPVPTPMPMEKLKKKMADELVPAKAPGE